MEGKEAKRMENILNSDLAKELLTVISYFEDNFITQLPNDFLHKLTDLAADSNKDFYIDENKNLSDQNLSEDCKNWISLLYYQNSNQVIRDELLNAWLKKCDD